MTTQFQLDTSGYIDLPNPHVLGLKYRWGDLDPFTQGYVEALLESVGQRKFDRIQPDALALIMKDCEAFGAAIGRSPAHNIGLGRIFFESRQIGFTKFWSVHQAEFTAAFPPLTVTLGDDGNIHLSEG